MSIKQQVDKLLKSYPDLKHAKNHDRLIRIIWAEDNTIRADSILRAVRYAVANLQ